MKPVVLPMIERAARMALGRRGVKSRFVSTRQGRMHVYDATGTGDLPTLVVLHGIGASGTPFTVMLPRLLAAFRRVVIPDLPGHGFSEDPPSPFTPESLFDAIDTTLKEVVPEPAVLAGNSLGGALALHHAERFPERVRALVLISPAGARSTEEEWRGIQRLFDIKTRSEAQAFAAKVYHRAPWFLKLVAHELPSSFNRSAVRDLLATATNDDFASPEQLAKLTMPVLLVWGKSERILPRGHFDYLCRNLPKHAVIEEPLGFGHCPHFDAPALLASRIVSFARSAAPSVPETKAEA